ncbi:hypothetical protein ACA910_018582 [Epithemia clementina (nom. ined.)]
MWKVVAKLKRVLLFETATPCHLICCIKGGNGLGIVPDDVSLAALLEAAANVGNRTLSDQLWELLLSSNSNYNTNTTTVPRKNINAYNARLKTLVLTPDER